MNDKLKEIAKNLDEITDQIINLNSEDRLLSEIYGWDRPSVNRHILANITNSLGRKIEATLSNNVEIKEEFEGDFDCIIKSLTYLKGNTIPNLLGANSLTAVPAFITSIQTIEASLSYIFEFDYLRDNNLLPKNLIRKLQSIEAQISEISPKKNDLESQIKLIKEATDAAETLPIDLENLKTAQKELQNINTQSAGFFAKIEELHKTSNKYTQEAKDKKEEADGLVKQCEEAYRVTTSKGLAGAFDERSKASNTALIFWVIGLIIALGLGAWKGAERVTTLSVALNNNQDWGIIAMQIVLSILSVGAPLWFAWMATKQINQRFRLSEDYAYKASIAKAYEGYRREAARIDPEFERRLFSSALDRLDEVPLRLMENTHHGSPFHEFAETKLVKSFTEIVDTAKEKFTQREKPDIED